jgi:hypothetical protein
LALHDRQNHIYGRGHGHASGALTEQALSSQKAEARVRMLVASYTLRDHEHVYAYMLLL